jgi:predicted DNA-binding transcriptional regulator AlpA
MDTQSSMNIETFLTSKQVRAHVGGVSNMCLWRWQNDDQVRFPMPDLVLNGRRYWLLATIRQWQQIARGGQEKGVARPSPTSVSIRQPA